MTSPEDRRDAWTASRGLTWSGSWLRLSRRRSWLQLTCDAWLAYLLAMIAYFYWLGV